MKEREREKKQCSTGDRTIVFIRIVTALILSIALEFLRNTIAIFTEIKTEILRTIRNH